MKQRAEKTSVCGNWRLLAAAGVIGICVTGCSTRNDPTYNRFAPNHGNPSAMKSLELGMDAVNDFVDDVDERFTDVVY